VFLDVGAGGVWVMEQDDGTVSHIDPTVDQVVSTIVTDPPSIQGGDITVGEGAVWVRVTGVLVARIDPRTDAVTERYGLAGGSGSAAAGSGALWISAHDVGALYRVPLS
jgi:streptogramin lyase